MTGPLDQRRSKSLAITMRTPGQDHELALGFLCSEGLIRNAGDVLSWEYAGPPPATVADPGAPANSLAHGNTLLIELAEHVRFRPEDLQRNFYLTSSCGICGKASLDAVAAQGFELVAQTMVIQRSVVFQLPDRLRTEQSVFDSTGGIHAAALFGPAGSMVSLREDVGRHNAVDKLVGSRIVAEPDAFPSHGQILVVSGRASFELVQKAISASIEMLVAVGAPSSLAVELADEFGLTLVGFASRKRFNIYTHPARISN